MEKGKEVPQATIEKVAATVEPRVAERLGERFVGREAFDELNARLETRRAEAAAAQQAIVEATERFERELAEHKAAAVIAAGNRGSEPKRQPSLIKLIRGQVHGFGVFNDDDGYEKEVFADLRRKALSVGTDTSGGFLAPEEFNRFLVERLQEDVAIRAILAADGGAPVPMRTDTMRIPAGDAAATAAWTAENVDAALSDPTTRQITLALKDLIGATQVANKLIEFADPSADAFVRNALAFAIAEKEDIDFFRADGSPTTEPTGLLNLVASGQKFNSTGTGGEIAFNDLVKAERLMIEAKQKPPFAWAMNGRALDRVRRLRDSQNRPLFQPDFFGGQGGATAVQPLGYPIHLASQLPNNLGASADRSEIYLVKGREVLIGDSAAGVVISASKEHKFLADATVIKAVKRTDVNVRHDTAAAVIQNVLATDI